MLAPGDPPPFRVTNAEGRASFLLIGDHAGDCIPRALGDLGLAAADRRRHIALDLGIAALGPLLATRLDAAFVAQSYSRLVIDCNRDPARPDAVPAVSDGTPVPGNVGLSAEARRARVEAIHTPYHAAIAAGLERGDGTALVALHSFTPALSAGGAEQRPWHAGVLYGGGDETFARAALVELRRRLDAPVGDNQPYAMDGIDYTIPHHCFAAGRRYVEFEIRQDLLTAPGGAERWAELLGEVLAALG
ncbi:MAG: N-formylglutamate amidohydrolase [Novosphingobium sp.]